MGTIIPDQCGPGSNGNEEVPYTPPDLEAHHQMQLSHIQEISLWRGSYPSAGDIVKCHSQNTHFCEDLNPLQGIQSA